MVERVPGRGDVLYDLDRLADPTSFLILLSLFIQARLTIIGLNRARASGRGRLEMPARVVVVDDDEALRNAVRRALRLEGYDVDLAGDGAEAIARLAGVRADLVVLDVLMPVLDGITVCRRLRESGDRTPILMLTARDAVADRVGGLDAGADDYLTKPFALEELLARVRALLRRSNPEQDGSLRVDDLELNPRTRQVTRGERALELTRTEFALLELLMRNAGVVLSREAIRERVWGFDDSCGSNTLDVYVGYLRRKTGAGGGARMIHTVRGVGFVLRGQ
jgi:two-component system response regulator MprA